MVRCSKFVLVEQGRVEQNPGQQTGLLRPVGPGVQGAALDAGIPGLEADLFLVEDQLDFARNNDKIVH